MSRQSGPVAQAEHAPSARMHAAGCRVKGVERHALRESTQVCGIRTDRRECMCARQELNSGAKYKQELIITELGREAFILWLWPELQ